VGCGFKGDPVGLRGEPPSQAVALSPASGEARGGPGPRADVPQKWTSQVSASISVVLLPPPSFSGMPPTKLVISWRSSRWMVSGSEVGIPRQVDDNYAHFCTWRQPNLEDSTKILGNLLTAAYLDPQDSMLFDEASKPVAVLSHILTGVRVQQ
jgi:hypothetical protein